MARRSNKPDPHHQAPIATVHQVVAYNFRRAREELGWTQAETSERLAPLLGYKLRQAGVSAIEKTFDGDRPRNLDVGEVVAFARCFGKPIPWFFIPPAELAHHYIETLDHAAMWPLGIDLVELAIGDDLQWHTVVARLRELVDHPDPPTQDLARKMIGYILSGGVDLEVEIRMEKRRQAVREVRIGEVIDTRDERIRQMAAIFLELVTLTRPEIRELTLRDPAEALRILSEAPEFIDSEPLSLQDIKGKHDT